MPAGNVRIDGNLEANIHKVYYLDRASGNELESSEETYGSNVRQKVNNYVSCGSIGTGWKNDTVSVVNGSFTMPDSLMAGLGHF